MLINRANLLMLFTGFKTAFQEGFNSLGGDPLWQKIAMPVPSTTSREIYPWLGQTTGFREWVGDRILQNLELHDFTIKNKRFENTVQVDRDVIEDDEFGLLNPLFMQLGQDTRLHPDLLVFSLLLSGFTKPCYDGQNFFDADHPVGTAGNMTSVSNFQGGTGRPWFLLDTTKALKPIIYQKRRDYQFVGLFNLDDQNVFMRNEYIYGVDGRGNTGFGLWQLAGASKEALDADSYDDLRTTMMSYRKDNGQPLNITPNVLLVAPQDVNAANKIVTVERQAGGGDNPLYKTALVVPCPWIQ